jgi:O-methyltransferase
MTSPERLYSLCKAVEYITKNRIPGDIVECGVWRGGSMVAVALTLVALNETTRSLWLYDTFEGMTPPTNKDVRIVGGRVGGQTLGRILQGQ